MNKVMYVFAAVASFALGSLIAMSMTGCGQQAYISYVPVPGPTVVVAPEPIVLTAEEQLEQDIATLVQDENSYRGGLGQTLLSPGLSCTLYTVTGGQYILNDASHSPTLTGISQVASFTYSGVFNQENASVSDGLNVLPTPLRSMYTNLFLLRCQGSLVVTETDYYGFELSSDDGSVLYLDGSRLIDSDGNHSITTKLGTKYLRKGVHTFRLDFAQTGGGAQALILKSNGSLVPSAFFYH